MVQMDGSFHDWLEKRGPEGCLIDMVEDATNTTWVQLGEQETIWAVADALHAWIARYRVPLALYGSICRNTTGGLRGRRRSRRTITVARRGLRHWAAFSGSRASARLARTGWRGTTIGSFNWNRRVVIYAPAQGKVLVCEGRHGSLAIVVGRGQGVAPKAPPRGGRRASLWARPTTNKDAGPKMKGTLLMR
jgi:hypothetical protein